MRIPFFFVPTLLICLSISVITPCQTQSASSRLTLTPCEIAGFKGEARCGSYEVFENRTAQQGRKISLKIVVLPAKGPDRAPDPFIYIPGGPGSSATEEAPDIAQLFAKIHERHDLLFVDQRGTGGSHPFNCELFDANDPASYFGYFFPLESVKKCREQLEKKADLTLYTTPLAMDDLDEVRAGLGYERLNLFGASYGTRAVLVYMKRHPTHVRTALLQGVAPTNEYMPLAFAKHNERALQGIISECAADETCNKMFPNLRTEIKAVLEQLLKGPIEVEVRAGNENEDTRKEEASANKRVKVRLSRDLAAEAIRYMLYHPGAASRVPLFLHLAAQGNFVPLAEAALNYRRGVVSSGSNGLYLSIICAEDLPWIKAGEGELLAANTFLGDYRLRQQREACALWPRGTIPADYSEPTRSTAPVLILTGEWDPVTPPSNAEKVARSLTNSLNVVVPHGAHGLGSLEGLDCLDRLTSDFVEKGSVKGLDPDCVKAIRRKGFALKL